MTIINADEGPVDTDARLGDILQGIAEGANPNGMSAVNKFIYAEYLKSLEEPAPEEKPAPKPRAPRKPKEGAPKESVEKRAKLANPGPK